MHQLSTTTAEPQVQPAQERKNDAPERSEQPMLLIQPKLTVGAPDDPLEREADEMAGKVMRMPENNFIQRKCAHCEEEEKEEKVQRKPSSPFIQAKASAQTPSVSDAVAQGIESTRGNGSSLDSGTRSFMESRFGADFSGVRVHNDSTAVNLSSQLNAQAFTVGGDIYFNSGKYAPGTGEGRQLIAHELTHTIQQGASGMQSIQRQPVVRTQEQLNQLCYADGVAQPNPSARDPHLHPTYERWLASFTGMASFISEDGMRDDPSTPDVNEAEFASQRVLGTKARPFGATGPSETAPVPTRSTFRSGEEFIDHPTNDWVQNCLPANLRATAYELPADCADIAVILRHVWLSAHHRTEQYGSYVVGDRSGGPNQVYMGNLIANDISSGNVNVMVQPYSDASGNPILNFAQLAPMLHPGDVLVWRHMDITGRTGGRVTASRSGGHTQTINDISRTGSTITQIQVLQGNQPINADPAVAILSARGVANPSATSPDAMVLRNLPGRRVESSEAISIANITDPVSNAAIWGEFHGADSYTVLVAAGPPRAASRPRRTGATRSITDWSTPVRNVTSLNVMGVLESLLQEARSVVEGGIGTAPTAAEMQSLGELLGQRMRHLHRNNTDNLIQSFSNIMAVINALQADANNTAAFNPLANAFKNAFQQAVIAAGSTVEESRVFTQSTTIAPFLGPLAGEVTAFASALRRSTNLTRAIAAAEQAGLKLWQAATARTHTTAPDAADDRPLYWTRLRMIEEIRIFPAIFALTATQRQQIIDKFEPASRGQTSASFTAPAGHKRILISGFDPFGLGSPASALGTNQTIRDSNPSGAAVLALDGQPVSNGSISGAVEGVIFPVRYNDFDQGVIEQMFTPFLNGTHPVSMIMTISQGGGRFDVEQWAGRRRSTGSFPDNAGVSTAGTRLSPIEPPGMGSGAEFLETRLPHQSMSSVPDTGLNTHGKRDTGGANPLAVSGTGGGFLSNEIFYRVRLLQTNLRGSTDLLPVGHLHIPTEDEMPVADIVSRVKAIIEAALPALP
jgi:pyrrolidone-carboxylate peptidase